MKKIQAKFPGICSKTKQPFNAGDWVNADFSTKPARYYLLGASAAMNRNNGSQMALEAITEVNKAFVHDNSAFVENHLKSIYQALQLIRINQVEILNTLAEIKRQY